MSKPAKPSSKKATDGVLIVSVPVFFLQRGGRKQIVVPAGTADWEPRARCENSLVNALARAHRWRQQIETGKYTSAAELSRAEGINESYLCASCV